MQIHYCGSVLIRYYIGCHYTLYSISCFETPIWKESIIWMHISAEGKNHKIVLILVIKNWAFARWELMLHFTRFQQCSVIEVPKGAFYRWTLSWKLLCKFWHVFCLKCTLIKKNLWNGVTSVGPHCCPCWSDPMLFDAVLFYVLFSLFQKIMCQVCRNEICGLV